MPLGDHLEDLRRRILLAIFGLLPLFVLAMAFGRQLLAILIIPVKDAQRAAGLSPMLQATGVLETFGSYLRVAFVVTLLVGIPWILWQLWRFVSPGLYRHERRFVYILAPLSVSLAASAVAFLYYVMLPIVLSFFIQFGATLSLDNAQRLPVPPEALISQTAVLDADPESPREGDSWINRGARELRFCLGYRAGEPEILGVALTAGAGIAQQYKISEYVQLVFNLGLAFAIGFQMPVGVLLLGWAGIISPQGLGKFRREAAMVCAVLAAILTPADPLSMVVLALPLYLLYEFGGILLRLLPASRVAGTEPADAADE